MTKRRMAKAAIPAAPQPALPNAVPATAWYIATVWMTPDDPAADSWRMTRQIVRLSASSAQDYREQVYEAWPEKLVEFGPISRSKVQG